MVREHSLYVPNAPELVGICFPVRNVVAPQCMVHVYSNMYPVVGLSVTHVAARSVGHWYMLGLRCSDQFSLFLGQQRLDILL